MTEAARAIQVPTLCVVGNEDGSTTPDLVRTLAELIPDSRFEVIQGAGHLPCIEKPDELAGLINRFFQEAGFV